MTIQETLEEYLNTSIDNLLRLVEDYCWNPISINRVFILTDFNELKRTNPFYFRSWGNKINRSKRRFSFEEVVRILNSEYHDLYDVNLYIFKTNKKETVIEILYYRKSNLEPDYFITVQNNPPMFHSKISTPFYVLEGERFDVNWNSELKLDHIWKSLLYRFMNKKKS
ncbi:hypothetical protein [Chryseobacterium flavum]|uniref:hypothetical protein n=1 Tax=Chryseobacterium flavum TaxID=415851 RepID=UPI0028B046D3|nr:hypothetical protein [Chryseobacterium flavum]